MLLTKNSHCSYCGASFALEQPWPRRCTRCDNVSYANPLPVAVVLVRIDQGLLLIRRLVTPKIGEFALPGGFIEVGETWQEAGAREVWEETGLKIGATEIMLFDAQSAPDGTVLIFGLARQCRAGEIAAFVPNSEVSEVLIADEPRDLAFPLHTQVAEQFWSRKNVRPHPASP